MTEVIISADIRAWLSKQIQSSDFSVIQLAGDASARRYYRVIEGEKTWVLMCWEPFQAETYPFISVQRHFASCEVQVPEVVAIGESLGVLLLEDLGDLTLERKFWESSQQEASEGFYIKTLNELIKIHDRASNSSLKSSASVSRFDVEKFLWEMNYAKEHLLLGLLKLNLSESVATELQNSFQDFCTTLANEPTVICHRDFHSRNVMIKRDKVIIIDFQDARLGPAQYDLVSLFKDSYVDMSDSFAEKLMDYYLQNSNIRQQKNFSEERFFQIYELQSLQRCFKACGSFASFMNTRQDRRYLKYLTPTLKRVMKSLTHFPQHSVLNNILLDAGALEKNYETLP
ncbi:aminoglycoside phosphotransferase family protein [Pseudobdellovibrio exovorus]|uniref:Aminoglycoside phosphotransferase domain-containing protein n=1 Tax=Pseudobdellovibrio exovorus JSS TaxID=1184267 RepID=M4V4V8_9BACT|nr:phosphotransferase [Pseudobdellovibrio exovorus]AGH94372.1 hypothetical protein A11Q_152 [Pseudobdellovibrio exovorus JSS]